MTFFGAGVSGMGGIGLRVGGRGRGPGYKGVATLLGSPLETLKFDRKIRVRDVLCGESMISANQSFWQDRVHNGSIFSQNLLVGQRRDSPTFGCGSHKSIPVAKNSRVLHSP